jgi:hypothetical protein
MPSRFGPRHCGQLALFAWASAIAGTASTTAAINRNCKRFIFEPLLSFSRKGAKDAKQKSQAE